MVPAAEGGRREAQVGLCVIVCILTGPLNAPEGGKPQFQLQPARSNHGRRQSSPPWGWGKLAFGLIPRRAAGRILAKDSGRTPPPRSQPQGVGPEGLESWKGDAVPTPRAAASGRWPTPLQQGKALGEWPEQGMGSAEWGFQKALVPASSSAKGTTAPSLGHSSRARLDRE